MMLNFQSDNAIHVRRAPDSIVFACIDMLGCATFPQRDIAVSEFRAVWLEYRQHLNLTTTLEEHYH